MMREREEGYKRRGERYARSFLPSKKPAVLFLVCFDLCRRRLCLFHFFSLSLSRGRGYSPSLGALSFSKRKPHQRLSLARPTRSEAGASVEHRPQRARGVKRDKVFLLSLSLFNGFVGVGRAAPARAPAAARPAGFRGRAARREDELPALPRQLRRFAKGKKIKGKRENKERGEH